MNPEQIAELEKQEWSSPEPANHLGAPKKSLILDVREIPQVRPRNQTSASDGPGGEDGND